MDLEETTRAHKARLAIRTFKIVADALFLRGHYALGGKSGQALEDALRTLSPEIYGTMNDPKSIELKGLEYILDRLPRGIEECHRIVLTAREDLDGTSFEKIQPPNRRRISYRVSENEMCFVITRGSSEIYDILTHMTFLYIEAKKLHERMRDDSGNPTKDWKELDKAVGLGGDLSSEDLDRATWSLSVLLGRTYHETKETYEYFEKSKNKMNVNKGLFSIVYNLGKLLEDERTNHDMVTVYFTPSLIDVMLHQLYCKRWAASVKDAIWNFELQNRPLHIISANMHSVLNLLYGYSAVKDEEKKKDSEELYNFIQDMSDEEGLIKDFAEKHGFYEVPDKSGAQIDCQLIDTSMLESVDFHPAIAVDKHYLLNEKPVLLIMDYAFGTQAFAAMDELLRPGEEDDSQRMLDVHSISVMGKAGILPGKKGDIMLASAHVLEGVTHTYIVDNDLRREDFDDSVDVYVGPIVTVLGTSLQNKDVLEKFQTTTWRAVGLEMEGGHYQRAVDAAIVREHISKDVKVRYAYYASDNPLKSGQTLASGALGREGIRPTYMITKAILEKIFSPDIS
ncbi:MAG: hypothetical protein ACERKR_08430 [Deltaproteobacteria bacterium]